MNRLRRQLQARLIGLAVLALGLACPRAAQAQSGSWRTNGEVAGAVALSVGGLCYVVGGTGTFLALDFTRRSPQGGIPMGIGVAQVVYASSLVTVGALTLRPESPAFGATLLGLGIGLAAIPIVDWSTRGPSRRAQAALRLTPTSVSLSGTF